jgi:hypothetical protein
MTLLENVWGQWQRVQPAVPLTGVALGSDRPYAKGSASMIHSRRRHSLAVSSRHLRLFTAVGGGLRRD